MIQGYNFKGASRRYPPVLAVEPVHMEMHLDFAKHEEQRMDARVIITCTRHPCRKKAELSLDAVNFLGVVVEGEGVTFTYDGTQIHLSWPDDFQESTTVTISYYLVNPVAGLQFQTEPPLITSDLESEKCRYFLPVVDHPRVRTTLKFHIGAPEGMTVLANGTQVEKGVWVLEEIPCASYLIAIAIGNLSHYDLGDNYGLYGDPRLEPAWLKNALHKIKPMVSWMEERVGVKLPLKTYNQVFTTMTPGAMECIGLVTWDPRYALPDSSVPEYSWMVERINIHELSHTWFGDSVVIDDHSHTYLKEGFATLMQTLWFAEGGGDREVGNYLWIRDFGRYQKETNRYVRPLIHRCINTSWQTFDMHTYPGGGLRLRMLRNYLGEDVFWKGVNLYLSTHWGKVADSSDFRKALETVSGISLAQFFHMWFETAFFPNLVIKLQWDTHTQLRVGVKQVQSKGVVLEEFQIEFMAVTESGKQVRSVGGVISLPENDPLQEFHIDPDTASLFNVKSVNTPANVCAATALSEHASVENRFWAWNRLVSLKATEQMDSVFSAATWSNKLIYLLALVEAKESATLVKMLDGITHPIILQQVMEKLASQTGMRNPDLRAYLLSQLQGGQMGPKTTQSILTALGRQQNSADINLLKEWCGKDAPNPLDDNYRVGAFRALGLFKGSKPVSSFLTEQAESGDLYHHALVAASMALAKVDPDVAKDVVSSLISRERYISETFEGLTRALNECKAELPDEARFSHQFVNSTMLRWKSK